MEVVTMLEVCLGRWMDEGWEEGKKKQAKEETDVELHPTSIHRSRSQFGKERVRTGKICFYTRKKW